MGARRGYTRAVARNIPGPSASVSMFSEAHHFNVGGSIQINSSQYVHNPQAQSIDGMVIQRYKELLPLTLDDALFKA
jgi:hypothetical protein